MSRKRFRKITSKEIDTASPLDQLTLDKIRENTEYLDEPSNGIGFSLIDWENKDDYIARWEVISGNAAMVFDQYAHNASGLGVIDITGVGKIRMKHFIPVSYFVGLGGYCVAKSNVGAQISVGIECYDKSYTQIGLTATSFDRHFVMRNQVLTSEFEYNQGIIKNEGIGGEGDHTFPQGTRFVKPIIFIATNAGSIQLDSYGFSVLTFSRESLASRFE